MSNISCPLEWQTETKELNSCQVTTNHSCGIEILWHILLHHPCPCSSSLLLLLRQFRKTFENENQRYWNQKFWWLQLGNDDMELLKRIVQFYYLWFSYFLSNLECCPSFKWWLNIYLVVEYKIGNFGGVSCVRKRRTSL